MSMLLAEGGAVNYTLICDAGSYTYTGQAATLSFERKLVCETGAYVYTGQDATLQISHGLTCDAGSYVYIGNDATLTYVSGLAQVVTSGGGYYRPYRYLPVQNGYDEEELKRLILVAEEQNREEVDILGDKSVQLYEQGVKLSEIRKTVTSLQNEMEMRVNVRILFDVNLKLKILENQRRNNMALLLLLAA